VTPGRVPGLDPTTPQGARAAQRLRYELILWLTTVPTACQSGLLSGARSASSGTGMDRALPDITRCEHALTRIITYTLHYIPSTLAARKRRGGG
jgi:hypothetical protein